MVENVLIRSAKLEDVDGILAIQENCLLKNKTIKSAEKDGFLVYPVRQDELNEIINSGEDFLFVAVGKEGIVGYALAHDLNNWRKIKSKWDKRIIVSPKTRDHLAQDRIIYFRHVARKLSFSSVGAELEDQVYLAVKNNGFKYVVGEILEHPISNEKSKEEHEKRGYKKIGQTNYLDGNFWGLYELELK